MADRPHSAQSQSCYDQLRRLLIHMQIRPGSRLVESEWAGRLGVHRTSLREAMSMLAHEGLLRRGERGGYFAPLFGKDDLAEVWACRQILEAGAIGLMADRPEEEVDVSALEAACDAMEQMLTAGYEMGFVEADRQFHRLLVELSGNQRLMELYNRAPLPLLPPTVADPVARRQILEEALRDHREIAKLIRERRIGEAVEMLQHHLHRYVPSAVY